MDLVEVLSGVDDLADLVRGSQVLEVCICYIGLDRSTSTIGADTDRSVVGPLYLQPISSALSSLHIPHRLERR